MTWIRITSGIACLTRRCYPTVTATRSQSQSVVPNCPGRNPPLLASSVPASWSQSQSVVTNWPGRASSPRAAPSDVAASEYPRSRGTPHAAPSGGTGRGVGGWTPRTPRGTRRPRRGPEGTADGLGPVPDVRRVPDVQRDGLRGASSVSSSRAGFTPAPDAGQGREAEAGERARGRDPERAVMDHDVVAH